MNKTKIFLITVSILIVLFSIFFKVLFVSSFNASTFSWVREQKEGIKHSFKNNNIDVDLKIFYMDTKVHILPEQVEAKAKQTIEIIKTFNPDVIITGDENALLHVAIPLKDTEYKFIFCGINNNPRNYNMPASNITGVYEKFHFVETIDILQMLDSGIRNMAVFSENTVSSKPILASLNKSLKSLDVNVVEIYNTNSFEEWKKYVKQSQETANVLMVLVYHSIKDEYGHNMLGEDVMAWTVENSKIPVISLFPFGVEDGAILAVYGTGRAQGYIAADMATKVLKGVDITEIKMVQTQDAIIFINGQKAKERGYIIPQKLLESSKISWQRCL